MNVVRVADTRDFPRMGLRPEPGVTIVLTQDEAEALEIDLITADSHEDLESETMELLQKLQEVLKG